MARLAMSILLADAEATKALGFRAGQLLETTVVICLSGKLGAGKTTFVQGLAGGLGVKETVSSPTFLMLNEYPGGRLPLYHADLYRISENSDAGIELLANEIEEMKETSSVIVVEWPELCPELFEDSDRLDIVLEYVDDGRRAGLAASGSASEELLKRLLAQ